MMRSWNRQKALREAFRAKLDGEITSAMRGHSKRSLRDMLADAVANTAALPLPDEDSEVSK
jgi:hypothetical protein